MDGRNIGVASLDGLVSSRMTKINVSALTVTGSITVPYLTPLRLVSTNAGGVVVSSDLSDFMTGTANRITVADDGDGTVTLSTPQDIATTSNVTFNSVITPTLAPVSSLFVNLSDMLGANHFGIRDSSSAEIFDIDSTGVAELLTSFECPLLITTDIRGISGPLSMGAINTTAVNLGASGIITKSVGPFQTDTIDAITGGTGILSIGTGASTTDVQLGSSTSHTEIVGTIHWKCYSENCKSGEALTRGDCVYISGATGNKQKVSKCDNTSSGEASHFFGICDTTVGGANQNVVVCRLGEVDDVNTSGYTEGQPIYLSTGGSWTVTEPTSGVILVIGHIEYVHINHGTIHINMVPAEEHNKLTAGSGEEVFIRLGDSSGVNALEIRDYTNAAVAAIDSNGAASFSSVTSSGQIHSTVSTGTAPMTIASTTAVTNLNADLLDGQHGSYYTNASNLSSGTVPSDRMSGAYPGITSVGTITSMTSSGTIYTDYIDTTTVDGTLTIGATNALLINFLSTTSVSGSFSATAISAGTVTVTDSPPFVITSNTKNVNLNADLLDDQEGSFYLNATNLNAGTISSSRVSGAYSGITGLGTLTSLTISGKEVIGTANGSVDTQMIIGKTMTLTAEGSLLRLEGGGTSTTGVDFIGLNVYPTTYTTSGGAANAIYSIRSSPITEGSGTVTTAYNVYINGSPTRGSTNWAFYVASGDIGGTGNMGIEGAITSTVGTGTAPLTVSSTTLCPNLNADRLDGQHGSYYQDAGNMNTGTLASGRLSGTYSGITGVGTLAGLSVSSTLYSNDIDYVGFIYVGQTSCTHLYLGRSAMPTDIRGSLITLTGETTSSSRIVSTSSMLVDTGGVGITQKGWIDAGQYMGGTGGSAVSTYRHGITIGGAYNYVGNEVKLYIGSYDNDAAYIVYPIYCEDENNIVDFYIKKVGMTASGYLGGSFQTTGAVTITDSTESTTTGTGCLILSGGLGMAKKLTVGGIAKVTDTTASSSTSTGCLILSGGLGVAGATYIGGVVRAQDTTDSTSITTGSVVTEGGIGIRKSFVAGGASSITASTASTSSTTGCLKITGGIGIATTTDASSSTNGGGLTCAGGAAIAKKLYVGTSCTVGGDISGGRNIWTSLTGGLTNIPTTGTLVGYLTGTSNVYVTTWVAPYDGEIMKCNMVLNNDAAGWTTGSLYSRVYINGSSSWSGTARVKGDFTAETVNAVTNYYDATQNVNVTFSAGDRIVLATTISSTLSLGTMEGGVQVMISMDG